jgi:ABC-type dipeptide/oligopeptide/nickel transport system permease component
VATFIVRRLIGMTFVMAVVSFLTYLIFFQLPGGDPAVRMAGKNPTPETIAAINREWGFEDPFYVQYVSMIGKLFSGDLISYDQREDVVQRIIEGAPRTFSLAIGAAILWFVAGVALVLFIGVYSRIVRSNVLDTINDDYVRTARAKGISERRLLLRHVLRNSLIPVVTLWGLDFGYVIGGGAILTERVFDIQGVGGYFADSITRLDVPPVLAVVLFGAFFIVLLNTVVDIFYAVLDPRIRLS